jgi:hypothetical protein
MTVEAVLEHGGGECAAAGAVATRSWDHQRHHLRHCQRAARDTPLLDKIRDTHPATPITVILDNARYQRCKEVATHEAMKGIELLYLPASSPNLNLI